MIRIGENTKLNAAQTAALAQARNYLRKQLLNPSPNVAAIYNTVKSYVDANPHLQVMVTNNLNLCQNAFGWGVLDLIAPTAITRQRYLIAVELTIGLLT